MIKIVLEVSVRVKGKGTGLSGVKDKGTDLSRVKGKGTCLGGKR